MGDFFGMKLGVEIYWVQDEKEVLYIFYGENYNFAKNLYQKEEKLF